MCVCVCVCGCVCVCARMCSCVNWEQCRKYAWIALTLLQNAAHWPLSMPCEVCCCFLSQLLLLSEMVAAYRMLTAQRDGKSKEVTGDRSTYVHLGFVNHCHNMYRRQRRPLIIPSEHVQVRTHSTLGHTYYLPTTTHSSSEQCQSY